MDAEIGEIEGEIQMVMTTMMKIDWSLANGGGGD